MDIKRFKAERQWIRNQLAGVADFWLTNGMDHEHGGVTTCLDRGGQVYSTDKSVWMQGLRLDLRLSVPCVRRP